MRNLTSGDMSECIFGCFAKQSNLYDSGIIPQYLPIKRLSAANKNVSDRDNNEVNSALTPSRADVADR